VLEALVDLGGQEALSGLAGHTVDPHQFLGLEINPRAAAIAELVLWIGHLQWHLRTKGGMPSEPILRAFKNIVVKDAVLAKDHENPRRPEWPSAEYIVGNPPFIGKGELMRAAFGQSYLDALWMAHPHMNVSADFVMYWWDRAAELLTRTGTVLRRFGFVTTNSITQVFNRRVVQRHLRGKKPVSLVMAISDHPWTKATPDAAAVRIAMTVGEAGAKEGSLREIIREAALDTDAPQVELSEYRGKINADLTIGADITDVAKLRANEYLSSNGMLLAGRGFVLSKTETLHFVEGNDPTIKNLIRPYINGRELYYGWSGQHIIDCCGLEAEDLRKRFPRIYQHLQMTVKIEREAVAAKTAVRDAQRRGRFCSGCQSGCCRRQQAAINPWVGVAQRA
jgi:hypothetical protein